jgi:hypothetical protein
MRTVGEGVGFAAGYLISAVRDALTLEDPRLPCARTDRGRSPRRFAGDMLRDTWPGVAYLAAAAKRGLEALSRADDGSRTHDLFGLGISRFQGFLAL